MTTEPATEQLTYERLAEVIAEAALDKKAQDIVALDLRGVSAFTDWFVIASGTSDRQVKAIHDGIHLRLKNEHGLLPRRVEGLTESRWVLMDYWDVVVHIFTAGGARLLPARDALGRRAAQGVRGGAGAGRRRSGTTKAARSGGLRWSGARGARTLDLRHAMAALSQLSYGPKPVLRGSVYKSRPVSAGVSATSAQQIPAERGDRGVQQVRRAPTGGSARPAARRTGRRGRGTPPRSARRSRGT